ncbi:MAG: alpha/beta fold hydrolase [Candidatus Binatia bacterium]
MTPVPACAERGRGSRTLVFLHGIGGNHRAFDEQLEHFGASTRAIAWDMPGYGASPPLERMTFAGLAQALVALFDARRVERAVVVGHSMGGMIAQELVAGFPDRVAALVLYATSPAFGASGSDWQRQFLADRLRPLDEGKTPADLAPALVAGIVGDEPDPKGIARAVECMSAIKPDAYRAALHCLVTFDQRDSLGAIRCPTLALAGERDRVASPAIVERMARAIPGAAYRVLPGVGHLANLERPAAFDAALEEFLTGLPG